jgi:phosphoribosylformylglycinamidine cyclo-ligase
MLRKILGRNYHKFGGHFEGYDGDYITTTDGVGTKILLASDYTTIGHDIVNHSVNDILCEFGSPIAFTNYIGMQKFDELHYHQLIHGMKEACDAHNVDMVGGETAIMTDVYRTGAISLVGTMIGTQLKQPRSFCDNGDVIVGFYSNGLHTNGYTLARKLFAGEYDRNIDAENLETIREALLKPHTSYHKIVTQLQQRNITIKNLCHITGGGWQNLYRSINVGVDFNLYTDCVEMPRIFELIKERWVCQDFQEEMKLLYNEFNMGIGMMAIVDQHHVSDLQSVLKTDEYCIVGQVYAGNGEIYINDKPYLRESY